MMINHIYSHCNFDIVGIEFTFSILSVAFNLNQEMFPCNSKKTWQDHQNHSDVI